MQAKPSSKHKGFCYPSSKIKELEKFLTDQPKTDFFATFRKKWYGAIRGCPMWKTPEWLRSADMGHCGSRKYHLGQHGMRRFRQWSWCPCDSAPKMSGLEEILNFLYIIFILTNPVLFFLVI